MQITPDFDPDRLAAVLGGPIRLAPVSSGQSNPTWFVTCGDREMVLRKKPRGATVASAHAIDREYRVLSALAGSGLPIPRMVTMEDDPEVIGTPFYLMERLHGTVSENSALPGLDPEDRRAIYRDAAAVLARLHQVDWAGIGLADYGRPGGYYERQVRRWSRQWDTTRTRDDALIDELAGWFAANLPPESPTTIVHGDYRIGNLMYGTAPARVVGVLDWELSTLGDPLSDLAHWLMFHAFRPDQMGGLAGLDLAGSGLPSDTELLDHYHAAGGCTARLTPFHRAFALFRMSVILEGITARARSGQAANHDALDIGALAPDFARLAAQVLETDKTPQFSRID